MQDYYKILQVDEHAEMEVIEAAYRRLAHKYHPDVNPSPDAQEHMRQINLAYETLHDPIKRAQYDRLRGGAETRKETSKEHYKRGPIFSMKDVYQKAGLEHLCREGEWYLFRIAWAKDFHATLNAMKSRIPPRFRYWDTMGKLWHVHSSYEHVLRDLFANFAISKEWSSQSQTSESCSDQQVRPPTHSSAKLVWAGLAAIALLAMFFLRKPPSPDVPVKEISFASPTKSYALPKAYELVEDAAVNEYHHGLAQTYESQLAATAQAEATFQSEVETLAPIEATIEALGDEAWCKYINPGEASHYIGEHVCLDFYVAHTRKYGQQVFLNSRYPYEGYFYVYIHQDLWNCWPQPPEVYFYGKWVRVWGTITEYYADWPEIILESCDSIQLLR